MADEVLLALAETIAARRHASGEVSYTRKLLDAGVARCARKFGEEFGVPLNLALRTWETFLKGKEAYGGAAQSTMIVKLLEDALKTDLRAPGFPARLE